MFSLVGTVVGLALLLPAYAIGMGGGDVKLLAGVGAGFGGTTFLCLAVSAIIGGVIAIGMVLFGHTWHKHQQFG
jgi:prepilin peptidase CpaA